MVACNDDDAPGVRESLVEIDLKAGNYYIMVGAFGGGPGGDLTLTVYRFRPLNDRAPGQWLDDAVVIGGTGFRDERPTTDATSDPTDPAACAPYGQSVWYSYRTDTPRRIEIDTGPSNYDTMLAVFASTPGGALSSPLACNDTAPDLSTQARLTFYASAGTPYLVLVGASGAAPADTLVLSFRPAPD